jgi:hypothetical protein
VNIVSCAKEFNKLMVNWKKITHLFLKDHFAIKKFPNIWPFYRNPIT